MGNANPPQRPMALRKKSSLSYRQKGLKNNKVSTKVCTKIISGFLHCVNVKRTRIKHKEIDYNVD